MAAVVAGDMAAVVAGAMRGFEVGWWVSGSKDWGVGFHLFGRKCGWAVWVSGDAAWLRRV